MSVLALQKTDKGWLIELPDEFTSEIGVSRNSIGLLQVNDGRIEVEIFPPPTPELDKTVDRIHEKYQDAFAEMKRVGD